MNSKVEISTSSIFKVVLILLLVWLLWFLRDLVLVLLTSVVIASAVDPAARWFARWRLSRVPAVLLIYALVFSLLVVIFYFLVPQLLNDLSGITSILPQEISALELPGVGEKLIEKIPLSDIISAVKDVIAPASGSILATFSVIFGGVVSFVLIVVISFYLSVQQGGIVNFLKVVTPSHHEEYIVDLWNRTKRKIGLWIQGQVVLGFIVGVLVYLGLTILGVKYALALALLAAVFEIIPYFGPILGAVPAVLLGFADNVTLGVMVLGLYIIIQQFENHLIYPLVVRKMVGVHPIVAIISLVVGAKLAGFLGVVLAVPAAAALMEIIDDLDRRKHATG